MVSIKRIIKKLSEGSNSTKDKKYTIVKFNVSNSCCTSQADNDFTMTMKRLSYSECIYYLLKECQKYLQPFEFNDKDEDSEENEDEDDEEDNEDDEDEEILYNGLKSIMETKRLTIYHCLCGLDFFIFNEEDEIILEKSEFYDENFNNKYDINMHFEY